MAPIQPSQRDLTRNASSKKTPNIKTYLKQGLPYIILVPSSFFIGYGLRSCLSSTGPTAQEKKQIAALRKELNQVQKALPKIPASAPGTDNQEPQDTSSESEYLDLSPQEQINKLKKELDYFAKEKLEMSTVIDVKQELPTVKETVTVFRSIRDQQHHDASSELRRFLTNAEKSDPKLKTSKSYKRQVIHELLFETLLVCYKVAGEYKDTLYKRIAYALHYNRLQGPGKAPDERQENHPIPYETAGNLLRPHLKDRDLSYFMTPTEDTLYVPKYHEKKATIAHKTLVEEVLERVQKEEYYTTHFEGLVNPELVNQQPNYMAYITTCLNTCWKLVVQDPPLDIKPKTWNLKGQNITFDKKLHKRALGSDRSSNEILYCVFPVVVRGETVLDEQFIEVVSGDNFVSQ